MGIFNGAFYKIPHILVTRMILCLKETLYNFLRTCYSFRNLVKMLFPFIITMTLFIKNLIISSVIVARAVATAEDVRDVSVLLDAQENGVATTGLGTISNQFDFKPESLNRCSENVENSVFQENRRKEKGAGLHANGIDRYGDMERALEQQAQLIGRFEAEENAQREWEEKYRENNYAVVYIFFLSHVPSVNFR